MWMIVQNEKNKFIYKLIWVQTHERSKNVDLLANKKIQMIVWNEINKFIIN